MKILLEIHGFDVVEAANGYEAVEKAVGKTPNLILMDMANPVVSGRDSTRTIRLHAELNNIPILAVTAYGNSTTNELATPVAPMYCAKATRLRSTETNGRALYKLIFYTVSSNSLPC
jgi:CheY-like chemotaxis protein